MNLDIHNIISAEILSRKDLSQAYHLSSRTGWNQTENDWVRLLDLNPETCFAFRKDNKIVGTSTLAAYSKDMAWIGMVIVDPSERGQGIGKYIMETTLQKARDANYSVIGLDATDMGRPLYLTYGFHDVQPIDRWSGSLLGTPASDIVQPLDHLHLQEALELDLQWSDCDRRQLIRHLFEEQTTQSLYISRSQRIRGFIFIRPGRQFHHIGPVLAETSEDFSNLLNAASTELQGKPVLLDVIRRDETTHLLNKCGLQVQRKLTRMTLGAPMHMLNDIKLRVTASLEWG